MKRRGFLAAGASLAACTALRGWSAVAKGVGKWMPEELIALAEKQGKK